ncbi:hypothetical protein LEMLEM_LOCUS7309 [Lemmus lemmus]
MYTRSTCWHIGPHCHSVRRLCFQVASSAEQKATVSSHAAEESGEHYAKKLLSTRGESSIVPLGMTCLEK